MVNSFLFFFIIGLTGLPVQAYSRMTNDRPRPIYIAWGSGLLGANSSEEAYSLELTRVGINVKVNTYRGLGYAIETLKSLGIGELKSKQSRQSIMLPVRNITDSPRFDFRGIYLDIASNFPGFNWIKKFINVMSSYKLNKLLLPIYNNEGFRLEIKGASAMGLTNDFDGMHIVSITVMFVCGFIVYSLQ